MSRSFFIKPTGAPSLPEMMLATIKALRSIGGSAHLQELDEVVIELEGIPEEEQSIGMPNDKRTKLKYFLAWSRTYLKRGGALNNSSRGVWALTDKGEKIHVLDQVKDIFDQVNLEERERARLKAKRTLPRPTPKQKSQEESVDLLESDEPSWRDILLETINELSPSAFERLSQRLLREAGFTKVEVRGKTGDGGIDGVGVLSVNLVSFQVYFQCKKWRSSVGSREIRDFRGALQGRADKGLFITTGTFTSQASDEATRDGAIAIDLIDGDRLCDLLKRYELGVKTQMIESVEVEIHWFQSI